MTGYWNAHSDRDWEDQLHEPPIDEGALADEIDAMGGETADHDPQSRSPLNPNFDIFDVLRWATHTAYPEARIPETPMPKWTPGPWTYRQSIDTVSGASYPIAKIKVPRTGDELRANAHLIAAAPELYAALDELFREGGSELIHEDYQPMLERARAALAKARGEL